MKNASENPFKSVTAPEVIDTKIRDFEGHHDEVIQESVNVCKHDKKVDAEDQDDTHLEKKFFEKFPPTKKQLRYLLISKENQQDIIQKKRQVLMTQLVIDSKNKEMVRYKQEIEKRTKALDKIEKNLEKSALEFDQNLKNQDRLVQSAQREAEKQIKKKQKLVEVLKSQKEKINHLKLVVGKMQSEIANNNRYCSFLKQAAADSRHHVEVSGSKNFLLPEDLLEVYTQIQEDTLLRLTTKQQFDQLYNSLTAELQEVAQLYQRQVELLQKRRTDLQNDRKSKLFTENRSIKTLSGDLQVANEIISYRIGLMLSTVQKQIPITVSALDKVTGPTTSSTVLCALEQITTILLSKISTFSKKDRVLKEKNLERVRRTHERLIGEARRKTILEKKIAARDLRLENFEKNKHQFKKMLLNRKSEASAGLQDISIGKANIRGTDKLTINDIDKLLHRVES